MQKQALTKTYQFLFVIFAILSIPSAYMAGLTIPLGSGIASLLDATFFSGEILKFTMLAVFLSAIARPYLLMVQSGYALMKGSNNGLVRVGGKLFFLLMNLAAFSFVFSFFVHFSLLPNFLISMLAYLAVSTLIFVWVSYTATESQHTEQGAKKKLVNHAREYFAQSVHIKSYWDSPALLILNFSVLILTVSSFGFVRTLTLEIGHRYCIITEEGKIRVGIIGRTDEGLILAISSGGLYENEALAEASRGPTLVHFLSMDQIKSIHWDCASTFKLQ